MRRADGSIGWIYSRAVPVFAADGVINEWFGMAADITARRESARRQGLLLKLADTLRTLDSPHALEQAATRLLHEHLGGAEDTALRNEVAERTWVAIERARAGQEPEARVSERTAELQEALDRLNREIAERQQAEERLRQSEKFKAVGQLTGGIAHDFNNMLQGLMSITGFAGAEPLQGEDVLRKPFETAALASLIEGG